VAGDGELGVGGFNSRGGSGQNHLRNEGFVSQDHIGRFLMKRKYANTTQKAYNTNII
jgi:hypothetical protein